MDVKSFLVLRAVLLSRSERVRAHGVDYAGCVSRELNI